MFGEMLNGWIADYSGYAAAAGISSAATLIVSHGLKPWLQLRSQRAAKLYAQANKVKVPGCNETEFYWLEIPTRLRHTGEMCLTLSDIRVAIGFQDRMDDYVPCHRFRASIGRDFDAGNAVISIPRDETVSETLFAALDEPCLKAIGNESKTMSIEIEAVELTTNRKWSKRLLTFSSGGHIFYEDFNAGGVWYARKTGMRIDQTP